MNLTFTAPISRPSFDGGTLISGMAIVSFSLDPDTLIGHVGVRAIEDSIVTGQVHYADVGPFTGSTTLAAILAAVKAKFATVLGVTFQ